MKPIIVCGNVRSGSSLACAVMDKLGVSFGKNVRPANEYNPTGYFENFDFSVPNSHFVDRKISKAQWQKKILKAARKENKQNDLWGRKIPTNTQLIPELSELFPDAYFIYTYRGTSPEQIRAIMKGYGWTQEQAAYLFDLRLQKFLEGINYMNHLLTIKLEETKYNTDNVIDDISNYLNIDVSNKKREKCKNLIITK